jgi:hypothetical protein
MADKINPMENPDLEAEHDDMENQGAANPDEVVAAEEDDEE